MSETTSLTRRMLLTTTLVGLALSATRLRAESADETQRLLSEVRKSFTLRGKPVPPEIFRDFGDGNLADSGSIWTSVDLDAAVGSNQYADAIRQNGAWLAQGRAAAGGKEAEETAYRYIGATTNGLLVAIATYSGGGTGVFTTLHILDLAAARAFGDDGEVVKRLTLTNLRSVALGDRWDGVATIVGNEVRITTTRGGPTEGPRASKIIQARRP